MASRVANFARSLVLAWDLLLCLTPLCLRPSLDFVGLPSSVVFHLSTSEQPLCIFDLGADCVAADSFSLEQTRSRRLCATHIVAHDVSDKHTYHTHSEFVVRFVSLCLDFALQ